MYKVVCATGLAQAVHPTEPDKKRYQPQDGYNTSEFFDTFKPEQILPNLVSNRDFNAKLYRIITKETSIVDLGCGSGGFIQDCLDDGYDAIGIDGYVYYYLSGSHGWGKYPLNFFNCDIAKELHVYKNMVPHKFDIITSFECFEHLFEQDVPGLMSNIVSLSHNKTKLIFSISNSSMSGHYTVRGSDWWLEIFAKNGFVVDSELCGHFGGQSLWGAINTTNLFLRHV